MRLVLLTLSVLAFWDLTVKASNSLSFCELDETIASINQKAEVVITSIEQADTLVREAQERFWQLFPPAEDWLYVHTDRSVRPVVWSSGWPEVFRKQMYADMKTVNGNLYPIYTVWAEADRITGDLTYFNMYGHPVWTSPAPSGYTPLSPVLERYGVESVYDLSEQQRQFSASNIGLEIQVIPDVFVESYQKDVVLEKQTVSLFAEPMEVTPMLMMMSLPVTNLQVAIYDTTNGTIEVELGWPSGFSNALEIFATTNLVSGYWGLVKESITTTNASNFVWEDAGSTNHTQRFYQSGDADLDSDSDGLADAREILMYGSDPRNAHSDADGVADATEISNRTDPMNDDDSAPLITIVTPSSTIVLKP